MFLSPVVDYNAFLEMPDVAGSLFFPDFAAIFRHALVIHNHGLYILRAQKSKS